MDSEMMMRSSTLSHRGGGGGGGGGLQKNHHDVENSSPRRSPSPRGTATSASTVTPTNNGHSTKNNSSTLLPITRTTTSSCHDNDKQRRRTLTIIQRMRLAVHHRNVYILSGGLVAIMLIVFMSSMSQFHWQSSSLTSLSTSSSLTSLSYYSPAAAAISVYPSSVTLYKLPDYAGLPMPILPHMYKDDRSNSSSTSNSNSTMKSIIQKWKPNYGGIDVRMIQDDDVPRTMFRQGDDLRNSYTSKGDGDDKVSWYYLVDDVVDRNPTLQFDDDVFVQEHDKDEGKTKECRLNSWEHVVHENCNTFHELDFQSLMLQDKSEAIGAGYYRDVFKTETDFGDKLVLKENSYSNAHGSYNFKDYHFVRKDGVVSAAIQPHPLIVDTYGFCALSFFTELMPFGDVSKYAIPIFERCDDGDDESEEEEESYKEKDGKKYVKKKKKKRFTWHEHTSRGELIHMNNLTATTKLVWALEMAESIALLNNHKNGVIVHDDVQLVQWLVTGEDHEHLKLNDFNRAEVMLYDEANQEYCKYRNNPGNGDWRAPEEYHDYPLDESIDIFSLGNNFHSLLTGLPPFPEECHVKGMQRRIKKKETSWIDPRWKRASFAEGVLVHVIERCWEYKPEDRISIGALVQLLRAAVEENKTKQHQPPPPPPPSPSQRLLPPPPPRPLGKKKRQKPANATTTWIRPKEAPSRR